MHALTVVATLPGGSWMFWIFGAFGWGWVSRGANTCGAMARTTPRVGAAAMDTEVLGFCRTVGLLTIEPVVAAEVCITVLVESHLLTTHPAGAVAAGAGFPPLSEGLVGVCIGGLTSVTVGAVFTGGWGGITGEVTGEEVVRIMAPDAAHAAAETGPLFTRVTAAWGLLAGTWHFTTTVPPFKVSPPAAAGFPASPSEETATNPLAAAELGWLCAGVRLGPAGDGVPSMLENVGPPSRTARHNSTHSCTTGGEGVVQNNSGETS